MFDHTDKPCQVRWPKRKHINLFEELKSDFIEEFSKSEKTHKPSPTPPSAKLCKACFAYVLVFRRRQRQSEYRPCFGAPMVFRSSMASYT